MLRVYTFYRFVCSQFSMHKENMQNMEKYGKAEYLSRTI